MQYIYMIMAFLGGTVLPVQLGLNTTVAKATANPIWAATISFVIGTVAMFGYFLASRQPWPTVVVISTIPPYAWIAGALGAFYITITIMAAPKIGAAMLISLAVAGQMTAAIILDHYGAFGFPQHSVNWGRIAGGIMVVSGVILIRKF
jgi:transporter family-2 protein